MSIIEKVSLSQLGMVLWQDKIVSLELFFQVVEVADHERVCFVVVWKLRPNVGEVSLDFNRLDVVIVFLGLSASSAGNEEKSKGRNGYKEETYCVKNLPKIF